MSAAFIGIDWGASQARFILADAQGVALEARSGPGVSRLDGPAAIEAVCFEAIGEWLSAGRDIPVVMAGMVGSNIGWRPAPYVPTPASLEAVVGGAILFEARGARMAILPGVKTMRDDALPDLMRGEETQILGAAGLGDGLVCLPGTHAKWARVESGAITGFHTALTGELMDIIGRESILLNPKRAPLATADGAFVEGVTAARTSRLGLESLLFTVRSRQVLGLLSAQDAAAYLAGLCIGADIRSAQQVESPALCLIGSPALTALYAAAAGEFGLNAHVIDGQIAVLAGLHLAWRGLFV